MKNIYTILLVLFCFNFSNGKEYSFNLANIKKGNQEKRIVWIVNTTSQPISILDVNTGCVCTKAEYQKNTIAAGDSSKVEITFHAKDPGVFYKVITVKTSDEKCDCKISIRGKVN